MMTRFRSVLVALLLAFIATLQYPQRDTCADITPLSLSLAELGKFCKEKISSSQADLPLARSNERRNTLPSMATTPCNCSENCAINR